MEDALSTIQKDGINRALVERTLKANRLSEYLAQKSTDAPVECYFTNILTQWAATGNTDYFAQHQSALKAFEGDDGQALAQQLAADLLKCANTALVTIVPQPGLAEEILAQQDTYLAEMKAGMTEEELDQLIEDTLSFDA